MPRRPPGRLYGAQWSLVEALATAAVFVTQGFAGREIADVAEAAGGGQGHPGTCCVESTNAVLTVTQRYAAASRSIRPRGGSRKPRRPERRHPGGDVQERLASEPASPTLREALGAAATHAER